MKLKDLGFILALSILGLLFSVLALLYKFFIENGVLVAVGILFIVLWVVKYAMMLFVL